MDDEKYGMKGGKSLWFFTHDNKVRLFLKKVSLCREFEYLILGFIVISSIQLSLENPLSDPNGKIRKAANMMDYFLTIIFISEALIKIAAFGFIMNGSKSYLRNNWNILDFIIVLISSISLFSTYDLAIIKILRLFRILRPLKMISKNMFLKISISSLFAAAPQIMNIILISFLMFIIFGIIGVSYFKG
jgi:hypothetical protein